MEKKLQQVTRTAKDVETRYDTSTYKLDTPLPRGKIKKVIDLIKDELGRKIKKQSSALRAKTQLFKVLEYHQKTKTLKGTFSLGQSFAIGLN